MVTGSPPPHHVTWVVAFRRDYEPDWRDFEDSIANFHPPRSSLRLFTAPQAQAVMATIAEEAGFSLPSALLKDLTEAIAQDKRISPVDIGITMLALHELARDRLDTELTVQQYRLAGGAEGLLTNYIQQALERYTTTERNSVLLALLSLADPSSDRRIAEGKTFDELSDAARTANARLGPMLSYLASPAVRILETWSPPEAPLPIRYRLPHERLIAPLRRLSGQLIADADRVVLGFQLAVQTWVGRGKRRGDLLSGRELRRALTHNDTVLAGGALGERTEFLRLSVRRRDQRRAMIAFASIVVLAVFFWGERLYTDFQHRQMLAAWGVPGNLYDHQSQLVDLSIAVPITDLGWMRAPLRSLTIFSNSPRVLLTALPSSLKDIVHAHERT